MKELWAALERAYTFRYVRTTTKEKLSAELLADLYPGGDRTAKWWPPERLVVLPGGPPARYPSLCYPDMRWTI